ncbi:MAG: aspartyl protease family protein [Verrucomicrobiales bacterium]
MNRRHVSPTVLAASALVLWAGTVFGQQAATFRRFTLSDGKTIYAVITGKTPTSVSFKLQNGRELNQPIRLLSEPDQQFVRKWTKFKDELLNNAEFSSLTVKEMLELRGYQSFEFDIEGNHIYVDGEVGGKAMRFMIDTGAHSSIIHDASAKEAKLEIGPYDQEIHGVAGKQKAAVTRVSSLKLGDTVVENRKLLATDFIPIGGGPGQFEVIFGADFLRELDAVISYREGRIFLKPDNVIRKSTPGSTPPEAAGQPKADFRRWTSADGARNFQAALIDKTETEATFRLQGDTVSKLTFDKLSEEDQEIIKKWSKLRDNLTKNPEWRTLTVKELLELRAYQSFQYRLEGNHILIDGLIGPTKTRFLIDTGAHSCVMDVKFASSVAKLEVGPMDQVIRGIGGEAPAALTKVPEITLGDAVIRDRVALSADIHKTAIAGQGNYDALFGAEFLRELDAVINYKEGRMFLKPDNSDKPETATPGEKGNVDKKTAGAEAADGPKAE